MSKKNVKRRKINPFKVLLFLLFLYVLGYGIYSVAVSKIKNIYVVGNYLLSDQAIIDAAHLQNYPSFFLTSSSKIKKDVMKKYALIENVEINKKFWFVVEIKVKEYEPLFVTGTNVLILDKNIEVRDYPSSVSVPTLVNFMPEKTYNYFLEQYQKIDRSIRNKISEIKYEPNAIDKQLFFLTMTDGNYVYLTLYKFESMNTYNKILSKLENQKGILYLDSGNYFDIFK